MDAAIAEFEGLVFKTATLIDRQVRQARQGDPGRQDLDDIRQDLRVKVWTALLAYQNTRSRMTKRAYVFMCVMNMKKDILKRRHHGLAYIEDQASFSGEPSRARDRFEERYLCQHFDPEACDLSLLFDLDETEQRVTMMLYAGLEPREIRCELGLGDEGLDECMDALRIKLAALYGSEHGLDPSPQPEPTPHAPAPPAAAPSPVARLPRRAAHRGARTAASQAAA